MEQELSTITDNKKTPLQVYCQLSAKSIGEAFKGVETIRDYASMADVRIGEMTMSYDVALCYCCVTDICDGFSRNNPMSDAQKLDTAKMIARMKPHYFIQELKVFRDMLVSGELPTGRPGQEEYEMKAVDQSSIISKLKAYDAKRPVRSFAPKNDFSNSNSRRGLSEYEKHHTPRGDYVCCDWDAKSAWSYYWDHYDLFGRYYEQGGLNKDGGYWDSYMTTEEDFMFIENVERKIAKISQMNKVSG